MPRASRAALTGVATVLLLVLSGCGTFVSGVAQTTQVDPASPPPSRAIAEGPHKSPHVVWNSAPAVIPAIPVEVEFPSISLKSEVVPFAVVDNNIDPGSNQEKPVTLVGLGSQLGGPTASYMGGHSCRGCDTPTVFDHLFDRAAQVALVYVGDVIYVTSSAGQRICFTVALVDRVNKDWLGSSDAQGYAAWHDTAGRLVIFTCFQEIDDVPSVDELVIVTDVGYVC